MFLPVTSHRSCLISGGGALLLGMCIALLLMMQIVQLALLASTGRFHNLIVVSLARCNGRLVKRVL